MNTQRYKVIADYPNSEFNINDIIVCKEIYPYSGLTYQMNDGTVASPDFFDKYKNIFKGLNLFENINESDIPKYVKFYNKIYKVLDKKHDSRLFGHKDSELEQRTFIHHVNYLRINYLPATQEEYENYSK